AKYSAASSSRRNRSGLMPVAGLPARYGRPTRPGHACQGPDSLFDLCIADYQEPTALHITAARRADARRPVLQHNRPTPDLEQIVCDAPHPNSPRHLYLDRTKVTILRVIPLSGQFGFTRHGDNTCSRSPSTVRVRTCSVPTHSGIHATSNLVVHLSPSTR